MAGSYGHCCNDDGSFRFDLIENMGDAHEACEQMHTMIWWLARKFGMQANQLIAEAEKAYHNSVDGEEAG